MADDTLLDDDPMWDPGPACRLCRCTMEAACEGGCIWVDDPLELGPLCSTCLPLAHVQRIGPFHPGEILAVGRDFLPDDHQIQASQMTAFLEHFGRRDEYAPLIVIVDEPGEVEHLDSDAMAALGWVPAQQ